MTKRKALVLLLLLACIAIAGLVIITTRNREPSYQGRTLSEWLDLSRSDTTDRSLAVRQMGTNVLPFLLEWIQYQPSPLRERLYGYLGRLPTHPEDKKQLLAPQAVEGFWALGEEGRTAIPTLTTLLDSPNREIQHFAAMALCGIGKDALPTLVDVLTNSLAHTNTDREFVGTQLWQLKTNAFLAKPALLAHIRDPDVRVACASVTTLGILGLLQQRMALPPESTADIVPALCANLDTTNPQVLLWTIGTLKLFHTNARPAVPFLLKAMHDPNRSLRKAATNALSKIDPQALQPAQKP